jgi:hypothetical protein
LDLSKREPKREPQQPDLSKREAKREPQQREPVKREPQQPARTPEEQKNFLANLKLNQSEGDEKW